MEMVVAANGTPAEIRKLYEDWKLGKITWQHLNRKDHQYRDYIRPSEERWKRGQYKNDKERFW